MTDPVSQPAPTPWADPPPLPEPTPWGFWSTLGLGAVAFIGAQYIGLIAAPFVPVPGAGMGDDMSIAMIAAFPIELVLLKGFVESRPTWTMREYLALRPVRPHAVAAWVAGVVVWYGAYDLLLWWLGVPIVPEVQRELYLGTQYRALLLVALVVVVPMLEELVFRGFMFKGWHDATGYRGSLVLLPLVFGVLHHDYGVAGIINAWMFGVLASLARLATGSLYPCIAMHAVVNCISMMETMMLTEVPKKTFEV